MTADEREEPSMERELETQPQSWWAGLGGPIGGFVLMVLGLGLLLWAFLGRSGPNAPLVYQAAKIVAVGLVIAGTTLVARRRVTSRRPGSENEDST
ncbi:hypothetical protein [Streptomyces sp. NPDC050164]|uniref:hypothetical protein n=1 Tax=Streptomyces sp. NPDC050164 TaxID=3365605 RepID=UPI0037A2D677